MSRPSKESMAAAKHLLSYLSGVANFGIPFSEGGFSLVTVSDANWSNKPCNGKSMSSYMKKMFNAPVNHELG